MSLAAKLPYDHAFAGGFSGIGSQPLPADADALDYLSRVKAADGAGVEVGVAAAVDAFFKDAKESGVFSALKACCILAGARTLAGALVPVVGDAPTNVADGFVSGDYSRTAGLTGDGTSYLDSGRANNADPQNDKHVAVYATSICSIGKGGYIGGYVTSPSTTTQVIRAGSALTVSASVNHSTGVNAASTSPSLIGASRDGTSVSLRADTSTTLATSATSGNPSFNIYVFSRNAVGSPNLTSDATLAFYSIGTSLDLAKLDNHITSYVTAIGAAL